MMEQKLRPRRMRISENMRAMVRETQLSVKDFVYPIFVVAGTNVKEEIPSMPNCYHLSVDKAVEQAKIALSRYESYLSMLQDKNESKYREAF